MKYIFSLLLLCSIANLSAQDTINWMTMDEALAAQEKIQKRFLWTYIQSGADLVKC